MLTSIKDEHSHAPLIITLRLDDESHEYFTSLRKKHFPAHVNYLDAHLTLFHKLPADEPLVSETLNALSNRTPFTLQVTDIKNIGNGVAFGIESAELASIHKKLQHVFRSYLISQDRQKLWPHITIQNKVTAFKALKLQQELLGDFKPFTVTATGFSGYLYLNGPWQLLQHFPFRS